MIASNQPTSCISEPVCSKTVLIGEVAEWLMAPVLKTGVPERVPGVRIPPSPPFPLQFKAMK